MKSCYRSFSLKGTLILLLSQSFLAAHDMDSRAPHGHYPTIKLEHPILEFVDGFTGIGIDAKVLGMIIHLRNDMRKMLVGAKQKDSTYIGLYTYRGTKHSLLSLIDIERDAIAHNDTKTLAELKGILDKVKHDFAMKVAPFLADAQSAKGPMLKLIDEWGRKTGRHDSHLLDWISTPVGQEAQEFFTKGTTLENVAQFIADLAHFLESLSRSCPKAAAQLRDLMQKEKDKPKH